MKKRFLILTAILALCSFGFVGCASTGGGGGGGDVAAAPAKPDYTDETGENGLLTPRAISARFVEAIGGEDALRSRTSMTSKGKMNISSMGMSGDVVIYAAAPNKFLMNAEMGGMGSMVQGYDGEVGFGENPMTGPQVLEGAQLNDMAVQADFYGPLNLDKHYPTQETVEETEFNGEAAYKVLLTDATGKETTQFYSKESGLMIGAIATQSSPMGEVEVTINISDYQDFGGMKVATKQVMSMMGMEIENTVEEVTYDDVDESVFELPDSIKALVE